MKQLDVPIEIPINNMNSHGKKGKKGKKKKVHSESKPMANVVRDDDEPRAQSLKKPVSLLDKNKTT